MRPERAQKETTKAAWAEAYTASVPSSRPSLQRSPSLSLLPLYLAQALATGATTVSTILASLIMGDLAGEHLSGLPATLLQAFAALSALGFAALMLRAGRRVGLSLAFGLGALGSLTGFYGASQQILPLFLLGAALMGAAQGGYQQARYAVAEGVSPDRRGLALGLLMLMSVAGSFLITAFAGGVAALSECLGTSEEVTGWLIGGGLLAVASLLMLFYRPAKALAPIPTAAPAAAASPAQSSLTQPSFAQRFIGDLSKPGVSGAVLAIAVAQGVMVTLMSLTPLRAHHIGLEHAQISALISLHIAGMFAFGLLTGPLIDRLGARFGYSAGVGLLLLAALTSPGSSHSSLSLSMFVLGLGWNLLFLTGTKSLAAHRGAQGASDGLGYFFAGTGTLLGGLVIGTLGFPALAYACAVLSLLPLYSAWQAGRG